MSTENYIRDSRFECHGAAIKWSKSTPAKWYDAKELRYVLKEEDWSDKWLWAHHNQFDGLILSHHYDVHPKMMGCTLSCARLLLGNHLSVGLDSLAKHFGLQAKIVPYNEFKGKHWHELSPTIQEKVADGACHDVELTWQLMQKLIPQMPSEEFEVIDQTIKMFSEPVLRGDVDALAQVWETENTNKQDRMATLNVSEAELQSANRFAELLRQAGVEPEKKNGKNGEIFAFAKSDPFMERLLEDEDDRVRTLVEARLGVKSTMLQTRAEAIGWTSRRGPLPVYLKYAGAHTTRWAGGDSVNYQNMNAALEGAILPPEGTVAFAPDSSQVECRILNAMAGQENKIEEFRQGRDPYVTVGSSLMGFPITKESHPVIRQGSKVVELQGGYMSGGPKIEATLRRFKVPHQPGDGEKWKTAYRDSHPAVVDLWKQGGRMISRLAGGEPTQWGPVRVEEGRIILPNGCPMIYSELHYFKDNETGESYWRHKTRHGWRKIYSGLLVENVIQALARVVVSQAMVRLNRLGYRPLNMKHDAIWYALPIDRADEHARVIMTEMCCTPEWMPGLPLGAEGKPGARFGK